ncbi:hypothetical protein [Engelhardtia mirabilis]|uniref:Peptidase family M50 n=1 Tax=Engelhardtia mirabilis TaxID=2528011 RepID=A0A518BNM6_9BACT|nr:Peptidase family M50 [Planctomycetes bacterium Pla133]QDV02868.1 Peptidase family M50 [Planctomycetes bacterium Pla86]
MTEAAAPGPPTLADSLRECVVAARSDLVVTRHLFRGEPCYVLRDPLTFESTRLGVGDYGVVQRLVSGVALGDIFESLAGDGTLEQDDEEHFYAFIVSLHRKRLLRLPIADDKALFRRHRQALARRQRSLISAPLFHKRSLWNPDPFLERTERYVAPVFTRTAFGIWLAVLAVAGWIAAANWSELSAPLGQVLLLQNLPLLWIGLIGLKVVHEFGHAYACRFWGGAVPEMGVNLIVLTPLPYVDASAAWSFHKKSHRLMVSLAGMYVELFLAAIGLIVWSMTEASLTNAFAYNVALLGSVVTVAFNLNPLMRFDGYYVASDLLEIPNLRARAGAYTGDLIKRLFLGTEAAVVERGRRLRALLVTYGVSAAIYKITLVLGISTAIASKYFTIGVAIGLTYIGMEVFKLGRKLISLLFLCQSTQHVRNRAVAVGVVGLGLMPLGVVAAPLPAWFTAPAIMTSERVAEVYVEVPGTLVETTARVGDWVEAGATLATIEAPEEDLRMAESAAELAQLDLRLAAARDVDPAQALRLQRERDYLVSDFGWRVERAARRTPVASQAGRVVEVVDPRTSGTFLRVGTPIARIASGRRVVRALLRDEQLARGRPEVGERVRFRPSAWPGGELEGRVTAVEPLAMAALGEVSLTHLGGGEIAVDPVTGVPLVPHFTVTAILDDEAAARLPDRALGRLWLPARAETVGVWMRRNVQRFLDRLRG